VGELLDVAGSILRQPNVWVAFALLCVGSMTSVSRYAKRAGWTRDRLYAGRVAAAALSLALAVTLARVTPGLSVRWRGCGAGWGLPIDSAEGLLNVLMLVPFGIAAGYALRRFWPVALVGLAASLLIELTQGMLGNGSCQGDDLVRNVAGVMAGALVGVAWADIYGRPRQQLTDR
jgi:VanZ like family